LPIHALYGYSPAHAHWFWHWIENHAVAIEAIALVLIFALDAAALFHFYEWLNRPKLRLDFENNPGHIARLDRAPKTDVEIFAKYVRVRATNHGRRRAKGCQPFLVRLEKLDVGETKTEELYDSLLLNWAGGDDTPRDIPRHVNFYVDLVEIRKAGLVRFCSKHSLSHHWELERRYGGTYRFHVLLISRNAKPARIALDVTYDGDWEKLTAAKAPKASG
jgi:hypothetical protein